jgi:hypothetical protein
VASRRLVERADLEAHGGLGGGLLLGLPPAFERLARLGAGRAGRDGRAGLAEGGVDLLAEVVEPAVEGVLGHAGLG